MTDIEERPPGPPLDQHMSFLLTADDRVPLLGLAWRAARASGREPQESLIIRRAVRIGVNEMLKALTVHERQDVMASGVSMVNDLNDRKRQAEEKRAARKARETAEQGGAAEPVKA